jgi:hypothetical protein
VGVWPGSTRAVASVCWFSAGWQHLQLLCSRQQRRCWPTELTRSVTVYEWCMHGVDWACSPLAGRSTCFYWRLGTSYSPAAVAERVCWGRPGHDLRCSAPLCSRCCLLSCQLLWQQPDRFSRGAQAAGGRAHGSSAAAGCGVTLFFSCWGRDIGCESKAGAKCGCMVHGMQYMCYVWYMVCHSACSQRYCAVQA